MGGGARGAAHRYRPGLVLPLVAGLAAPPPRPHRVLADLADLADADGQLPGHHTRRPHGRQRHRAVTGAAEAAGAPGHGSCSCSCSCSYSCSWQQERLTVLGVKPARSPSPARAGGGLAAEGPGKAQQAFPCGPTALAQWVHAQSWHAPQHFALLRTQRRPRSTHNRRVQPGRSTLGPSPSLSPVLRLQCSASTIGALVLPGGTGRQPAEQGRHADPERTDRLFEAGGAGA